MKFIIIGPGILPIPSSGWGACENIIYDYYQSLTKLNHQVEIVNKNKAEEIIEEITRIGYSDVIHFQYDDHLHLATRLSGSAKLILATTHFAYLTQSERWNSWRNIFNYCHSLPVNGYLFVLSEEIKQVYLKTGIDNSRLIIHPNGAREDLIRYTNQPKYDNRTLCLGKIEARKGQFLLHSFADVYFVGKVEDKNFIITQNYLGEWSREDLYNQLTDYANLVLLSDGEADPLVVKEALMAGLGIVVTKVGAANLNLAMPFIEIVERNDKNLEKIIEDNRKRSLLFRREIHQYALDNFSYKTRIADYLKLINKLSK